MICPHCGKEISNEVLKKLLAEKKLETELAMWKRLEELHQLNLGVWEEEE